MARTHSFLVASGVFLLDQVSKFVVSQTMALHEGRIVIPGFFNLTHVQNRGAAFGIFSDSASPLKTYLLIIFSAGALAIIFALLWRGSTNWLNGVGLALIFGGALGNLLDRLRQASVVDFLDFYVNGYHWPAFNLADSAIVIGACLLLYDVIFARAQQQNRAAS